jgi:hypothetical protein
MKYLPGLQQVFHLYGGRILLRERMFGTHTKKGLLGSQIVVNMFSDFCPYAPLPPKV